MHGPRTQNLLPNPFVSYTNGMPSTASQAGDSKIGVPTSGCRTARMRLLCAARRAPWPRGFCSVSEAACCASSHPPGRLAPRGPCRHVARLDASSSAATRQLRGEPVARGEGLSSESLCQHRRLHLLDVSPLLPASRLEGLGHTPKNVSPQRRPQENQTKAETSGGARRKPLMKFKSASEPVPSIQ